MTSAYYDWTKRENKIYVKNASSTDGVQALVQLALLEGMNSDGSDIRFSDTDGNALPYWIEGFADNIFNIWVKCPTSDFIIYYYYGNPLATSESSGKNTFELFDDFSAASHDTDIWQGGERYSVVDGELVLTGTAGTRAWISSKNSISAPFVMEYQAQIVTKSNNINMTAHIHAASNTQWVGNNVSGYFCSDMDNVNGSGFLLWKCVNSTYSLLSNKALTPIEGMNYFSRILAKSDGIEHSTYTENGFLLQGGSTTDTTRTSGYIGFDVQNAGVTKINRVMVRKYVATQPTLVVVYDLEKLDPESIDITESMTSAYKQLTAKFKTNLVPPEQSRIIYYTSGADANDILYFYGRVINNSKTDSSNGISVDMVAADDMYNFVNQKVPWYCVKNEHVADPQMWVDALCDQTDLSRGYYNETPYTLKSEIFEISTSKYDALQKILDYHRFMIKPYYAINEAAHVMPNEAIAVILPGNLDADPNYSPPSPITFLYPDAYLVDSPTIERSPDERDNRVIVHGTLTSTGNVAAAMVVTKDVYDGIEIGRDFVINDNFTEERGDSPEWEAVRWLLYFQADRAKVNFRLMNTVGIELYQRIKFGDGFSSELQKLTNQKQFEYVYAGDLLTGNGVYTTFHEVATSPVPRPSWLRISSRHYHKDHKTQYTDYTAITDYIISSVDPEVPIPYNRYGNGGMTTPTVSNTGSFTQRIIEKAVNKRAMPEYGVVQASPVPTATRATLVTDSGKTIVTITPTTLVAGVKVLVVPDTTNGTYYVST
jgi:hypothetical protein